MTDYILHRAPRKTLSLSLDREGRAVVRAPCALPRDVIDRFVASHEAWLARAREKQARHRLAYPEPTEAERAALIARAKADLPARVERWAGVMGLSPAGVRITAARSRFGSCSAKGRLCFSFLLMRYPDAAIDYVVVHELAHLRHPDHSPAFYAFVARYLPDWRARMALLKE